MLITKEVEVRTTGKMIRYYQDKGYGPKYNTPLIVKIEDLPNKSNIMISAICDYCGELYETRYADYYETTNGLMYKCACKACAAKKHRDMIAKNYGVDNVSQLDGIKEKKRQTVFEHYGVYNPRQSFEVQQTTKNTNLQKYGAVCPLQNADIKEKAKKTCIERYGYENAAKSDFVINKKKKTMIEKYGVENSMQVAEVRQKAKETMYKNGTCPTSKQQYYINSIYEGELNYPCRNYNLDIFIKEANIDIEVDFGGHNLSVKLGNITQEEFDRKELVRDIYIKREGIKIMRIISSRDKIPSDTILLQMLSEAKQYFFDYPEHSWIEYNIDASTVRCAEHKDGVYFDYGKLRTIKTQQND